MYFLTFVFAVLQTILVIVFLSTASLKDNQFGIALVSIVFASGLCFVVLMFFWSRRLREAILKNVEEIEKKWPVDEESESQSKVEPKASD